MKPKWLLFALAVVIAILAGIYLVIDPERKELNEEARQKLGGTYIRLSDGVTHYRLEGPPNGRLVVLLHGGTIPSWTWDKQIQALTEAGFRTLSYDTYGRGYSDRPDVTYDQELNRRQLLELVEKLGFTQPFDLIGFSVGGGTAVNFAARYPDRVAKLILISPVVNNFKAPSVFRPPVLGEFLARFVGIRVITDRANALYENHPESEKYKKLFAEQTTYKGFQRAVLSMLRNDVLGDYNAAYQTVGKQTRSILLIWGTNDTEITEAMIKDIRSFIPNITFVPVKGVGHGIPFQEFDQLNSVIVGFL